MSEVLKSYLWVALGSAVGGMSRFWLSQAIADRIGGAFPWGTIVVNISGSFVIGIFAACSMAEGRLSATARLFTVQFLMFGICGGYTTFSSFSLQTLNLAREGEWLHAGGNVLVSVAACLIAVWLGYIVGQLISRAL